MYKLFISRTAPEDFWKEYGHGIICFMFVKISAVVLREPKNGLEHHFQPKGEMMEAQTRWDWRWREVATIRVRFEGGVEIIYWWIVQVSGLHRYIQFPRLSELYIYDLCILLCANYTPVEVKIKTKVLCRPIFMVCPLAPPPCEENKEGLSSLDKYPSIYEIIISGRLHKIH